MVGSFRTGFVVALRTELYLSGGEHCQSYEMSVWIIRLKKPLDVAKGEQELCRLEAQTYALFS